MADMKRRVVLELLARNRAAGQMASFRGDMDSTGQAMKRMAAGALASVGGLYALKRGFDYVIKAAMKQEDALFLLEAALKAAGEYSNETMKGFEAFAASIQQATIYGDEEVLALMQLMKSLGVTSAGLEKATKMAIGLAAATGRDVKSMSMYIALAQQGEFTMLRRYIPALRSTADATEQLRIITEFAARGFEIAEAKAETASGSIKQMWNAVSDLAEVAGKPILEPMAGDAETAKWMIEKLTEAIKKNNEAMEEALITEGGYLKRMAELPEFYNKLWDFLTTFEIPKPPFSFEGGGGGRFGGYGETGGWEEPAGRIIGAPPAAAGAGETETQKQLAEQAKIRIAAQARIENEIAKMSLSTHDYKMKLMEEEIEKYREAGISKIDLDEFRAGRSKEIAADLAKETSRTITDEARGHIDWLREQDDMTRDQKIENLNTFMEAQREAWGEQEEAERLLAEEHKRYQEENLKGWALVDRDMRTYIMNLGNWGQKLSSTLGSAFEGAADNFAAMLMQEEVDWKAFGRAYLKQILSMIIQTYILAAVKAAITKDYEYVGAQATGTSMGQQAAQSMTWGGRYETGGYVGKTGLALVHQGEYVNTKEEVAGGMGGGVTVNVINNAGVEVEVEENQDERIVNLVINAMATHGPMRRAVSNAGRRRG